MSTIKREVVISGRDELSPSLQRVADIAQSYGRELGENLAKNAGSLEETIKYLEKESELLRKNNVLRRDGSSGGGGGGNGGGPILPPPTSSNIGDSNSLLAEILDAIKEGNGGGGNGGGGGGSRGGGLEGGIGTANSMMGSGNMMNASSIGARSLGGMMGGIGGMALGAVGALIAGGGLAIGMTSGDDSVAQTMSRLIGGSGSDDARKMMRSNFTDFQKAEGMGIGNEELAQLYVSLMKRTGSADGVLDAAKLRNVGMESGTIASMSRLRMFSKGGSATNNIYSALANTGLLGKDGQNFGLMDELMGGMGSMALSANTQTGADLMGSKDAMSALNRLGGVDGMTPDRLQREMSGLHAGLAGGSQMAKSYKLSLLRGMKGNENKTFFELQNEMDKGLDSGLLESSMVKLKAMSGNRNTQQNFFNQLTGGQMSKQGVIDYLDGVNSGMSPKDLQKIADKETKIDSSDSQVVMTEAAEFLKNGVTSIGDGIADILIQIKKMTED